MTSYSTLMRQAKAAKTETAKAALLKKANSIRRKTRNAKKPPLVQPSQLQTRIAAQINRDGRLELKPTDEAGWQVYDRGAPGQGEIINGAPVEPYHFRVATETFNRLKEKKKIDGNAEIALRSLVMTGVSEGRRMEREANAKSAIQNNRAWRNNIVRAFISECNVIMQMNKGLPGAMVVSGLSIARVLDALAEAGWSEHSTPAISK